MSAALIEISELREHSGPTALAHVGRTLAPFAPRCALEWLAARGASAGPMREAASVAVRTVTAFLDVSGFTPMTERLSERGPAGAEQVCAILSEYFAALLDVVHGWGGDVIKFAGDALLVSFAVRTEGTEEARRAADLEAAQRAVACALAAAKLRFERHDVSLALKVRSASRVARSQYDCASECRRFDRFSALRYCVFTHLPAVPKGCAWHR